jgi:hypothetical protein
LSLLYHYLFYFYFHANIIINVSQDDHICMKYIENFKDPLVLLLIGSAILSVLVGITFTVLIVGTVSLWASSR